MPRKARPVSTEELPLRLPTKAASTKRKGGAGTQQIKEPAKRKRTVEIKPWEMDEISSNENSAEKIVFETDSTYKVWRDAALGSSTHPTTKLKSKPMQATHPSILPKRTRSNGPPKQPIPGLVKAHLRPKQTAPRDKGLETIMSDHSLPAISLLSSEDVAPHQDDDTPNSHQRDSTPLWSSTNSDDYPPEIGESPQPADWPDTDSLTRSPKCFGALQDDVPFRSNGFELSDIPTPVRRREITPISQLDLEEWQEEDWEICSLSSPSRSESDPELILVGGTNNPEVKIERGLSLAAQYEAEHPEDKPWDGNWRTWPRCLNVGEWGAHLGPWSFEYDEERTARAGGIQWTVLCDCCGGLYLVSDSNAGTIWPEIMPMLREKVRDPEGIKQLNSSEPQAFEKRVAVDDFMWELLN